MDEITEDQLARARTIAQDEGLTVMEVLTRMHAKNASQPPLRASEGMIGKRSPHPPLSEAEFQRWLVREARAAGWLVYFVPDWMHRLAMASMKRRRRGDREWPDKGFPDVWCVHVERGELAVFECKRDTAPPSAVKPEQRAWISGLRLAGIWADVVRPRDRDRIRARLRSVNSDSMPQNDVQ